MATDPFVPAGTSAAPRHRQNQPAGIAIPPAEAWEPARPGDATSADRDRGMLLGSPSPNGGFALTLAMRSSSQWRLARSEHLDDAVAVVADLAMKRASMFHRAPCKPDVDVAVKLLGYDEARPEAWVDRRAGIVHGAGHDYQKRRSIVDFIDTKLLALPPHEVADSMPDWVLPLGHSSLRSALI